MFVNQQHLQYLLQPEHYYSEEHFQRELQELFLPAWQFVAVKSELPHSGDFLTLDLFGHPLLIRNDAGHYVAFQNVCAHRHCLLTDQPRGHSSTLRCQYHGWEYDRTGKTARIPDARCFRPWDRENSQLVTYRLETCGDLLFVALSAETVSLQEWLAPHFEALEKGFSLPEWRMGWAWDYEAECNWKVPAENTLESYHVPALHHKFYGDFYPDEKRSFHKLTSRYTELTYLANTQMEAWQSWLRKQLGGTPVNQYVHRHIHPNTILVTTDTFNCAWMFLPLSPRRVRIRLRTFAVQSLRRNPLTHLAAWVAGKIGQRNTLQIHGEDLNIYASQQQGLETSRHRGVIGTREERIYTFQTYLLNSLGIPLPVHPETRVAAGGEKAGDRG